MAGRFCSRPCTYAANRAGKTGNHRPEGLDGIRTEPGGLKYATVYRPGHPMARANGEILKHRYVMAEYLGRPLLPSETVHHIDGDTLNNELSNLQLRQGKHGKGVKYRCMDCGSHRVEAVPLE